MIEMIISAGETGIEKAVLDAAIEFDIPYSGIRSYNDDQHDASHDSLTSHQEINIFESEGTLIINKGNNVNWLIDTKRIAMKQGKPWLFIDLDIIKTSYESLKIMDWILSNRIRMLNVIGSQCGDETSVYQGVNEFFKGIFLLDQIDDKMPEPPHCLQQLNELDLPFKLPTTMDESVDWIISKMSLRERTGIANADKERFSLFSQLLVESILVNDSIREECHARSVAKELDDLGVKTMIVDEIWQKLQETDKLKVVK